MRLHIGAGMIKNANHIKPGLLGLVSSVAPGSYTFNQKDGHPEPRYYIDPETNTSRNSIGLENQGINEFHQKDLPIMADMFANTDCELFPSLAPTAPDELYDMCSRLNDHRDQIAGIEINAACPNHYHEGKQSPVLAHDPAAVEKQLQESTMFKGRKRLKIAPKTSDRVLDELLELCEAYDIETIVSGNTLSESSVVGNIKRLHMPTGGMAGAGLLDIAVDQFTRLKALNDRRSAPRSLIACGGVMNPYGIRRYHEVGATDVAVATYFWEFGVKGIQDLLTALPE
jgi:dihydroorotate dehydrogenase